MVKMVLDRKFIGRLAEMTAREVIEFGTREVWAYSSSCDLDATNGGCSERCFQTCAVAVYVASLRQQLPHDSQIPVVRIGQKEGNEQKGIYSFDVGYFLDRNVMPAPI